MLFLRIPPFVRRDAMPVAICASEQGRVTRGSTRVRIVVIAVRKISTVIQQEPEPSFPELVVIAFDIIATELIDDDYDDELRMSIVGGSKT